MADQHFSMAGSYRLSYEVVERCEAVAHRMDHAKFHHVELPDGWRFWFSTLSRSAPHNQRFDREVADRLAVAGLLDDSGQIVAN